MTRRRKKTDGEKVAHATEGLGLVGKHYLAARIDRLIRKRMAQAWEDGWFSRDCQEADWDKNPYRRQTSHDRLIHTIQGRVKK